MYTMFQALNRSGSRETGRVVFVPYHTSPFLWVFISRGPRTFNPSAVIPRHLYLFFAFNRSHASHAKL